MMSDAGLVEPESTEYEMSFLNSERALISYYLKAERYFALIKLVFVCLYFGTRMLSKSVYLIPGAVFLIVRNYYIDSLIIESLIYLNISRLRFGAIADTAF